MIKAVCSVIVWGPACFLGAPDPPQSVVSELSHDGLHTSPAVCDSVRSEDSCAGWDQLGGAQWVDWMLSMDQDAVQKEDEQMAQIMYHNALCVLISNTRQTACLFSNSLHMVSMYTAVQLTHMQRYATVYTSFLVFLYYSYVTAGQIFGFNPWRWVAQVLFDVSIGINSVGRFSVYAVLSWPGIPRPTLVNTPTDLQTNHAGADKHAGQSRLDRKQHTGHYHVNVPIDCEPS